MTALAVVGMACRLPRGIDSPRALWDALLRGEDLVTEIPSDRWNADDYYDPESDLPGRSVSRWGAFLDEPGGFDHAFFGIGEREALAMDPQHRLLLEVTWEAAEHSGRDPRRLDGTDAGVFFGLSHQDYAMVTREAGALGQAYSFTGTPFSMASGRVAHAMGLKGPAITIDTACSSSLVAIHTARRSLLSHECDVAFAGGVMLMFTPTTYVSASGLGMLSPTGRCHSFDASADGFVRAEACGVVMLKRLSDARRDHDRVLAVIRGSAINQDGRTHNILAPSRSAQTAVMQRALAESGIEAASVGMLEAHGTGTPVGDTEEYHSLSAVYGRETPCALGSLKSTLGHAESAAGVMGVIKAVLSLEHGIVPGLVNFHALPEHLQRVETKLFIPTQPVPFPSNGPDGLRRAAVSSYGMSGTNAHVVLERDPADPGSASVEAPASSDVPRLFPLSATSTEGLRASAARLATWLETGSARPWADDLAHTLSCRRGHRTVRHALIAGTIDALIPQLRDLASGDAVDLATVDQDGRGPVFVFSGQGSQWGSMGTALLASDPVFADTVAAIEPLIDAVAGFSVTEVLRKPDALTGIDRIQPAIFTMQVALAASLRAKGVSPSAVIGHSLGEVSAAVVAGALSVEDGVLVICHRALLCRNLAGLGAMAVVELTPSAVREELARRQIADVETAVIAAPTSTVIGGAVESVRRLVDAWQAEGLFAREVAVDVASHTSQVEPILAELALRLSRVTPLRAHTPIYSTALLDPRERPICDAGYWVDNLRHPVRFRAAVQAALEDGHRVFMELSPHPLLVRAIVQNAAAMDVTVCALPSMMRGEAMPHGLLSLVATIYMAGAHVDFRAMHGGGRLLDAPLPAWTHPRLFHEPAPHGAGSPLHVASTHPLLNIHRTLHEEPERHVWASEVGLAAHPWLADHQVNGVALFPGAGFCEMAFAAARNALAPGAAIDLRALRFERALRLESVTPVVATSVTERPGHLTFRIESQASRDPQVHATAVLAAVPDLSRPPAYDLSDLRLRHATPLISNEVWQWFGSRAIQFGPSFRALASSIALSDDEGSVFAGLRLPAALRKDARHYTVHPVLLDACFQSVAAFSRARSAAEGRMLLPLSIRSLQCYGAGVQPEYCVTRLVSADALRVEAEIDLLDASGAVLMRVSGLVMGSGAANRDADAVACNERLLSVEWRPWEVPAGTVKPEDGAWLLIHGADAGASAASDLHGSLSQKGFVSIALGSANDGDRSTLLERVRFHLVNDRPAAVVVFAPLADGGDSVIESARVHVSWVLHIARELTQAPTRPRLFVISRLAQHVLPGDRPALDHAGLRGFLRTLGAEFPSLHPTQIDLDLDADARVLARQLLSGSDEDEVAIRDGAAYVARLQRSPLAHEDRRTVVREAGRDGLRVEIRTPGDLQSVELAAMDRRAPGPGEVEVAVRASSVNFADVLVALGRYPSLDGQSLHLGLDFAGVVTALGEGVDAVRVGQRVAGMCPTGCWRTYVTCAAPLVVPVPDTVSDAQAAAILTTTATAWYGLEELARIGPGDKVLIHSATGGVGQAAVAIARAAGAEIFATAGSEERRALLRARGHQHVFDSRSPAFAEEIRRETAGYGVDIVLNSLTGASQRAGIELLATGGRFVEIGKKDIYGDTWLGLSPFKRNLSFFAVDLALMCRTAPARVQRLLTTVMALAGDGRLQMPDIAIHPLTDAETAMRVVGATEHIGKLVLSIPQDGAYAVPVSADGSTPFRGDSSYIITGGLGGLGLFLADHMSAAGCGRLVINSRSAPRGAAHEALTALRARGAQIEVVVADIADPATASRLVEAAKATGLPLRGVLHAAAVVEDGVISSVTDDLLARNWAPKVSGAWHLHFATREEPLDWFCCFSSVTALFGSPGQAAYASANSWLDGFTRWRRAQRLPSNTIAWAAWATIGAGAHLAERGDAMIAPRDGAYAFDTLLRHDRAYAAYAHVDDAPWLTALAKRSPSAADLVQAHAASVDPAGRLRAELARTPREAWPTILRRLIVEQLGVILRRAVNPDRPFFDYGLDSLGTLQLLTALEVETGIRLGAMHVTTVRTLADTLCEALTEELPEPSLSSEMARG